MIDFKDKKILVTGATGGIGHALVKKFVSLNANVLATGTKTEKLDSLKNEFPNINILKFDISNHSKIEEFVENVYSQLVGLDVLINNAGINKDNLSLRMKEDEWKKVIWKNCKYYLYRWTYWEFRSSKLCCFKSWNHWYDKIISSRICKKKYYT